MTSTTSTTARRILILQGHPDPVGGHLDHALAQAYADAASSAGHQVQQLDVGQLDFPLLERKVDFEDLATVPENLKAAQTAIEWAEHLVIVHPLWLGGMPARLKGFLEQVLRPGFAFVYRERGWERRLSGRSARIVITMAMPTLAYRFWFGAHGLKLLKRSILGFCGFKPVRSTLFGVVDSGSAARSERWLAEMARLGKAGR